MFLGAGECCIYPILLAYPDPAKPPRRSVSPLSSISSSVVRINGPDFKRTISGNGEIERGGRKLFIFPNYVQPRPKWPILSSNVIDTILKYNSEHNHIQSH